MARRCAICDAAADITIGRLARVFVAGRHAGTSDDDATLCATHKRQVADAEVDFVLEAGRAAEKGSVP